VEILGNGRVTPDGFMGVLAGELVGGVAGATR